MEPLPFLFCFFASLCCASITSSATVSPLHARKLTKEQFKEFRKSDVVKFVYFYDKGVDGLEKFIEIYDESAEMLKRYGLELALLDCDKHKVKKYCTKQQSGFVHVFKNDWKSPLALDVKSMYDQISMVAHMLQMHLMEEAPIVQEKKYLDAAIDSEIGKRTLIFTYLKALGSEEHYNLMKIAAGFEQNSFRFVITTSFSLWQSIKKAPLIEVTAREPSGDKDLDSVSMILRCAETKQEAINGRNCPQSVVVGAKTSDLIKVINNINNMAVDQDFLSKEEEKYLQYMTSKKRSKENIKYIDDQFHILIRLHQESDGNDGNISLSELRQNLTGLFYGQIHVIQLNAATTSQRLLDRLSYTKDVKLPSWYLLPRAGHQGATEVLPVRLLDLPVSMTDAMSDDALTQLMVQTVYQRLVRKPAVPADWEAVVEVEDDRNEFERQDDQVEEAVFLSRHDNLDLSLIPALTEKTFADQLSSQNLTVVLFYMHWEAVSKAFLWSYASASKELECNKSYCPLARVNCYDWPALCQTYSIYTYPKIKIFETNEEKYYVHDYKKMLDKSHVVYTVRMYQMPQVRYVHDLDELKNIIVFKEPAFMKSLQEKVVVFAVFNSELTTEYKLFEAAIRDYRGDCMFVLVLGKDCKEHMYRRFYFDSPRYIVLLKGHDPFFRFKTLFVDSQKTLPDHINKFIELHAPAHYPELTVNSLPSVLRKKQPIVIYFGSDVEDQVLAQSIGELGKSFDSIVFCWVDMLKGGPGADILREYNPDYKLPTIVVLDKQKGFVYNYPKNNKVEEPQVDKWLDRVFMRDVSPSKILPVSPWKPLLEGYNYLELMKQSHKEIIDNAEEVGLEDEREETVEHRVGGRANDQKTSEHHERGRADDQKTSEHHEGAQAEKSAPPLHTEF